MSKQPAKKKKGGNDQRNFTLICSLAVFAIMMVTLMIFSAGTLIMQYSGLSHYVDNTSAVPFIFCAVASFAIGTCLTPLILRVILGPVSQMVTSMRRLTEGHFDERLDLGNTALGRELADSFNTLAAELQNTELLRTDFINNFSHEFKTPIVSIRGFARLLQRDDLPAEQRRAYLDVIVDESTRLSNMATNVLNLSKVENQQILTDVSDFNLSEQLRRCILLLEKGWVKKELEISVDFKEFSIRGSEELLRQVWVNLLENAVKFTPEGGCITVRIYTRAELLKAASSLQVDIVNTGSPIPEAHLKRVFDKFWQGDASRAGIGAGVGLSIVRKIVELHSGTVSVASTEEETTFSVILPLQN